MTIEVREAREDELDETARVLALAFEQVRPKASTSAYGEVFERYLEGVVDVRSRVSEATLFVAIEGGRILGTGTLYPPGRTIAYAQEVHSTPWPNEWASLRLLGVDPAHRGRGIGRMLIEARVRRARELGATVAALHTSREFEVAHDLLLVVDLFGRVAPLDRVRCGPRNEVPGRGRTRDFDVHGGREPRPGRQRGGRLALAQDDGLGPRVPRRGLSDRGQAIRATPIDRKSWPRWRRRFSARGSAARNATTIRSKSTRRTITTISPRIFRGSGSTANRPSRDQRGCSSPPAKD